MTRPPFLLLVGSQEGMASAVFMPMPVVESTAALGENTVLALVSVQEVSDSWSAIPVWFGRILRLI
jgi:hypothetical protein